MDIVTLAAAKKYTDDKLKSSGNSGAVVDSTLTVSGAAADAKATGDRLGAIEYQTVTTDIAYEHKDLPEIEKTVTFDCDGAWGNTGYINYGIDLLPRGGFNKKFPWCGLTITQKGDIFKLTGQVTSGCMVMLTKDGNTNYYNELPDGLIGKTLNLFGYTDNLANKMTIIVQFYDENKTELLKKSYYLASTTNFLNKTFIVPEGTIYYSVGFYSNTSDFEFNHETKLALYLVDEFEEISLLNTQTKTNITNTSISTFPYECSVSYKVTLNEYISNFAGGGTVTYLTPEDFGAKGDGSKDDIEAITDCLEQANSTKQTVLMAGKYYITTPIEVKHNGLNIIANDIVYDGTDTAIKINGQSNSLKIHSIISNGIGITYRADNNQMVSWNDVDINSIMTKSHGIVFYNGLRGIFQNTIKFNYISADGPGTYGICELDAEGSSWVTENNFYGGQIANCEWAVYNVKGNSKFYGIQIETNVEGGFYINGGILIFYPRISEAARDGNLPIYKFVDSPKNTMIYGTAPIPINEIDLSEASEIVINKSGSSHGLTDVHFSTINAKITTRIHTTGEDVEAGVIYADKAYVWGKRLILIPRMRYEKVVDSETLDTRLIGRTEETYEEYKALSQLPTKFVVNTVNTNIYLHPSYCSFGYSEFEVKQSNGFTCKVYDYDQNLVFDGTEQGNGLFRISVSKDAERTKNNYGVMMIDKLYQVWSVEKVITKDDISVFTLEENENGNFSLILGGGE